MEAIIKEAFKFHKEGKLDLAERLYYKILETQSNHTDVNYNLGVILSSQNKLHESLQFFEKAVNSNRSIEYPWVGYILTLTKLNKLLDAEVACKRALESNHQFSSVYYSLGLLNKSNGDLNLALEAFIQAIQIKPGYAEAHFACGTILQSLNRLNEAIIYYKKAIEFNVNFAEAYNNLGTVFQACNHLSDASKSYKKAIEIKPDYAEAFNNLGSTQINTNKFNDAEASYRKATELKKDYVTAYTNLGSTLNKLNRLDDAVSILDKANKLKADDPIVLRRRGEVFLKKKEFELALKDFDISNTAASRVYSLACLYSLKQIDEIYERIKNESKLDEKNIAVAAFSTFFSHKEKKDVANNFCKKPLDFIKISNLSSHFQDTSLFVSEIIKELQNVKTSWQPLAHTTINGFHSTNDTNLLNLPFEKLGKLKSIVEKEIDSYYLNFKEEDNCIFIKDFPLEKELYSWHVILKKQGYQKPHIHISGWLSGVIYLKVVPLLEKNEGAIEFSLNGEHYYDKNSPNFIHKPKVGDIVLFPSSLHHSTIPFSTDTDRIIVSFDLLPKKID